MTVVEPMGEALTSLAFCWRVERRDGAGIALTSHGHRLDLQGVIHEPSPGILPAAITRRVGLEPSSAEVSGALRERGVTILVNETFDVQGLRILGLGDMWAGQMDLETGLARLGTGRPSLVLSHNPDTVDQPGWANYRGWILSGHTHGGQCKPPFLPPPFLPVLNRRYTAGEFELRGSRRLYISRGVGHLTQVRFNVRPEVTVFELQGQAG